MTCRQQSRTKVLSGQCRLESSGCVTSSNFGGPGAGYGNDERCEINWVGPINVMNFSTEAGHDYLQVAGRRFSGDNATTEFSNELQGEVPYRYPLDPNKGQEAIWDQPTYFAPYHYPRVNK